MIRKFLRLVWMMVRRKDIMQSLLDEGEDSGLVVLFTRRSYAVERVVASMLDLLKGEGIYAEIPAVRVTRSWVRPGETLGYHQDGFIVLNGVSAVRSGLQEFRLTIGHEIGHYIDTPECRRELGIDRRMDAEVWAETVAHFLQQRRRYPPIINGKQRSSILKRSVKIARKWKHLVS